MKRTLVAAFVTFVLVCWAPVNGQQAGTATAGPAADVVSDVSRTYCLTCHNNTLKTGGLSLEGLSLDRAGTDAETLEKVVRKVRAGLMPPAGARRPERGQLDALASRIERAIDQAAAASPNPGRAPLHRMNRAEYANAVRDLLALDVDVSSLLPPEPPVEPAVVDAAAAVVVVAALVDADFLSELPHAASVTQSTAASAVDFLQNPMVFPLRT